MGLRGMSSYCCTAETSALVGELGGVVMWMLFEVETCLPRLC